MRVDRRRLFALLAAGFGAPALAAPATKNGAAMSPVTAYAFSFAGLRGGSIRLADYAGKPIMVVNTASLCGYTPQYQREPSASASISSTLNISGGSVNPGRKT